ncbi:MAG: tRNA (adenosine(37)-N6)-threonylcarbamoyltransferase complex dimerization subunit type 1 TsaB [Planctomycetota bacterium]
MAEAAGLTLAIETSNPNAPGTPGVALGVRTDGVTELIATEPLGEGERHDDLLMPAIERLFRSQGRSPVELERVAVSAGPGGYTGLRIATAAANLIALTTGAMVARVPSACVVAHALPRPGPMDPTRGPAKGPMDPTHDSKAETTTHVCLACKGSSAWVTRFDAGGAPIDLGALRSAEDLGLRAGDRVVGDRFLPEPFRAEAARVGASVIEPMLEPAACLALAWSVDGHEAGSLTPLYGREAEAVTRWRELHGGP